MREAEALLAREALGEALAAYFAIAQAVPEQRAFCTGVVGDIHLRLGELASAQSAYESARAMGANPQWVAERLEHVRRASSAPPSLQPSAPPGDATEIYVSPGGREVSWGSNQNGCVVIRPAYVAFLPTERATHIAGILAKVAVAGAMGATWVRFGRPTDPRQFAQQLRQIPVGDLDAMIGAATAELGGTVFRHGEALYHADKLPLGWRLYFQIIGGRDRIHVGFPKEAMPLPVFQRLTQHWQRGRA